MRNILHSAKMKYATLAMVVLATVAIGFNQTRQVANSANCPGSAPTKPTFNYWPLTFTGQTCHDYPMIDGKNQSSDDARDSRYSQSQAEHDQGITAAVGDSVRVLIYFHNGASDQIDRALTTAHNATVSTQFDTTAGTTHTASATLSADNAATVTSAQKGGNIKINTASPTTLSYIPHSAYICVRYDAAVERGADLNDTCGFNAEDNKPQILIPISDSINNGSFNLGDLKACFPYSGFLAYSVKVNQAPVTPPVNPPVNPGSPALSIVKQVRDVTAGHTAFTHSETANNGDIVEYKIDVTDTGSANATNVVLNDSLNGSLAFVSGTNALNGFSMGTLTPGQTSSVTFQAKVNATSGTLPNTATAKADSVNPVSDTANVTVNAVTPPQNTYSLSIAKSVKDVTTGSAYGTNINVNKGDIVQYQIVVTNTGNSQQTNVNVHEDLPSGINYQPSTLSSSMGTAADLNNIHVSMLDAGAAFTVTFQATVTQSSGSITNHASATSDQASAGPVSATINVNQVVPQYSYSIGVTKLVKNLNQNTSFQKAVNAQPNERVAFQITVQNLGTGALNNVYVTDALPSGLSFASGSVRINGNNASDSLIGNNLVLGSLNAGQSATVYFEATVTAASNATLINTATAASSNTGTAQDTATVFVSPTSSGNVNLVLSKRANNDTQNVDATRVNANKEDFITYTLTTQNTGNVAAANFVVSDDLSNVLPFADIVNLNGGALNGNVIYWPAETVGAGQTSVHTFRVRVKYNLPARSGIQMVNTYGNTVVIPVTQGQVLGVVLVAPRTGANALYAGFGVAGLLTAAFWFLRKKFRIRIA